MGWRIARWLGRPRHVGRGRPTDARPVPIEGGAASPCTGIVSVYSPTAEMERMRKFRDSSGAEWRVWEVRPAAPDAAGGAEPVIEPETRDGWLCFQSGGRRRRVAPVPPGWDL